MTVSATLGGVFLKGVAGSRPAANAVAGGTVYSATDTGVISQSDGSSWSTWATISAGLADPMTTRGDIIARLSGGTGRLALGATGKGLFSDGTDVLYKYPPGYELDYVEVTSSPTATATSEATASTIITGNAVTYDGSTIIKIEMFCPWVQNPVGVDLFVVLYDGSSSIGKISLGNSPDATNFIRPNAFNASRRLTPSAAAHTYSMRAYVSSGTATFGNGAGGVGNYMPAYMRITKVSGGA